MSGTSPRPRALVTGGSGFLGAHLLRRLVDDGWNVRCATRAPWAGAPAGVECVAVGDVGPATEWLPALDGIGVVFHLAARAHAVSDVAGDADAEYERVNADGTARLARSARRAGVRRLVYVSSVGVHGDRSEGGPLDESSPLRPHSAYARSKVHAEQALRAEAGRELEFAVLRPPLIHGAGVPGNLRRLMHLVAARVPLPLAAVRNRRSLAAAANVVEALLCCGERAEADGQAYLVADGVDFSTPEIVRILALGLGVRARLLPVPQAVLNLAARIAGKEHACQQLCGSLQVDARKLRSELGWIPPVDARSALCDTARWYARVRPALDGRIG